MQLSLLSFLRPKKPSSENAPTEKSTLNTGLPLLVEESIRAKRASGRIKPDTAVITLPLHWSKRAKEHAIEELRIKLSQVHLKQERFLSSLEALQDDEIAKGAATLSIQTLAELTAYVHALNATTFQAPLKGVRMGRSKLSHLAQVNLRTGVMTVSRYCLGEQVPAEAFRYLILHELAHFQEANHSQRFWALVARYCPDYKRQRQLMRLYFQKSQG